MFRSRLKSTLRSKQTDICNVLHRHLTLIPELSFPYSLQLKWTLSKQTNVDLQVFTQKPLSESIMDPKDEKDCEISNSSEEDLTRMGKFVRFLVRIYFLPLKLGDDQNKTTFSLCSLPTLLNFLFYYLSSVSLTCLANVFYFSEEKRQTTMKSSGVVDILSGLSFHTTILLLFPGVPLLFGQVISGVEPSPCFFIFLVRTTFFLESLPEAKNPGQDAILEDFVFNSSNHGRYGLIG